MRGSVERIIRWQPGVSALGQTVAGTAWVIPVIHGPLFATAEAGGGTASVGPSA